MGAPKIAEHESEQTPFAIPIRWESADDFSAIYANELYIMHTADEFYLVFGQMSPPIPPPGEDNPVDHVTIKPVAKVAVPLGKMIKFAEVISENVMRFKNYSEQSQD